MGRGREEEASGDGEREGGLSRGKKGLQVMVRGREDSAEGRYV